MGKDYAKVVSDNTFLKKMGRIGVITLLIGAVLIILAVCTDLGFTGFKQYINRICSVEMKCRIWQIAEAVFNIVVTYSTVLVAVVVFFYSMIDNKRLGIPYRRLMAYTIGSWTIPVLFVVVLVLTVVLTVIRLVPLRYTACFCEVYILVIQSGVIVAILLSTSYQHCKRVICEIEKRRYIEGVGLGARYNTEWAYFFCHLERAVHSEEFLPDKKELLMKYLWIPFNRRTGKLCRKTRAGKRLGEVEELERIYQFYFVNILSAFQDFGGDAVYLERNQLYRCIGDFVMELSDLMRENMESDTRMVNVYHMILSGIMNGLASSNVDDKIDFCGHILLHCIPDSSAVRRQMHLFVLFQEMLSMINSDMLPGSTEFKNLGGWTLVETEDVVFCAKYWQIWSKMYVLSFMDKIMHFENAMQTMSGRGNRSAVVFGMMMAMQETV